MSICIPDVVKVIILYRKKIKPFLIYTDRSRLWQNTLKGYLNSKYFSGEILFNLNKCISNKKYEIHTKMYFKYKQYRSLSRGSVLFFKKCVLNNYGS